jgi:hypothetical protein
MQIQRVKTQETLISKNTLADNAGVEVTNPEGQVKPEVTQNSNVSQVSNSNEESIETPEVSTKVLSTPEVLTYRK